MSNWLLIIIVCNISYGGGCGSPTVQSFGSDRVNCEAAAKTVAFETTFVRARALCVQR